MLSAIDLLRGLAVSAGRSGDVEACAVLLNAAMYLASPVGYARYTSNLEGIAAVPQTLDGWIRGVMRGKAVACVRVYWSEAELEQVRREYVEGITADLARKLNRTVGSVNLAARKMGLHKSSAAIARDSRANMLNPNHPGRQHQFSKGIVPLNKGLKRPGWAAGRMCETQFPKGHRPHTWRPIGTETIDSGGFRKLKVTDTGYPPRDWAFVHRLLWQECHGPIPKGHVVTFRDKNRKNIVIGNLELISMAENARRNSIHNLPPELKQTLQLTGVLNRKIRFLEKRRNG